jgi:hypothetical protein
VLSVADSMARLMALNAAGPSTSGSTVFPARAKSSWRRQ